LFIGENQVFFNVNDQPHSFYIVKTEWACRFYDEKRNPDKCDEGDILGLRPLIINYLMDAMAREESLLYAIQLLF
jgi:CBS domain-containing protein